MDVGQRYGAIPFGIPYTPYSQFGQYWANGEKQGVSHFTMIKQVGPSMAINTITLGGYGLYQGGQKAYKTGNWDDFQSASGQFIYAPIIASGIPRANMPISRLLYEIHMDETGCTSGRGLTQAESSALNRINNILTKNLKQGPKGDISGAVHDMVGNPIPKPGGGTWDHVQDLGNMLRGLRNNAATLSNATDPAAVAAREQALQNIQHIEETIRGAGL